jgi:hypothetical protein
VWFGGWFEGMIYKSFGSTKILALDWEQAEQFIYEAIAH